MDRWASQEGTQSPLGVTWIEEEQAFNFALYSKHATEIVLLLYTSDDTVSPAIRHRLSYLTNKSGRVWHCRIPASQLSNVVYYASQVEGPFEPEEGHRFDPEKIFLNPYAKAVLFPLAFDREAAWYWCGRLHDGATESRLGRMKVGRQNRHAHLNTTLCSKAGLLG